MKTFLLCLALLAGTAQAQTVASEAWARGTVPAQRASGLYLQLRSGDAARLVGASTPAAGRVEIHEVTMNKGVMTMRQVRELLLPAGRTVELKPGGYHLMLMDLNGPLSAGDSLPLSLQIERPGKPLEILELQVSVRALGAKVDGAPGGHGHGHGH